MVEALLAASADGAFGTSRDRSRARMDAWVNEVTGFGTTRDKTTYGRYAGPTRLSDSELTALYSGNDLAARMVDHVPDEMFREGVIVETGDAELNAWVAERLDNLNACDRFSDGERWGRLYGGGAVLIGADDGRPASTPLIPERARGVRYLYDFDRRSLWPASYYTTPGHPKLGQPETYLITSHHVMSSTSTVVHESRLILFGGAKTDHWTKQEFGGWDLSILQRPNDVIRMFETGWKAVEIMMTDANQAVFKMTGLADLISAPNGQQAMEKRFAYVDKRRSVVRALVVDADSNESFERQSASFDSIPNLLDKFCLRLAASVPMPVTILMGQSPAGMNATGDSDFRGHYDRLKSRQTLHVAPRIRHLVKLILQSKDSPTRGKVPETITVTFPPLWTPTPMEEATRRKTIAEADALYIQNQVFTPDEVALTRGRPDGLDAQVLLSDEAIKAREKALSSDLDSFGEQEAIEDEGNTNVPFPTA